ncbi:MAG: 30S ribosomal protein S2 [Candidatus Micrarchaeia archaeon]|jgi:small subunit ribosomal protein S2
MAEAGTEAENVANASQAEEQKAEKPKKQKRQKEQQPTDAYTEYLEAGMQIGAMIKAPGMSRFIFKTREDGLHLFDIKTVLDRIALAAKFLARYPSENIVVTASRVYALTPAKKFAEITGAKLITGRVLPGIFTNPNKEGYVEPDVVLVSDPRNEHQAVSEASKINIPVVALVDTDNWIKNIDLIVPCNNKGRKSLAMIYFLLTKELLKAKGQIKSDEEFKYTPADFEAKIELKQSK